MLPGTLLLLSVTTRLALRMPATVGVQVTVIGQLLLAAKVVPQVVLLPKSLGLAPVKPMPAMLKFAVPVLLRVKGAGELLVPPATLPKL